MSFTSSQIRESGFIHGLADDAADEIEQFEVEERKLKYRIAQLEADLADARKDQARYCYAVENMLILSEEDGMFLVEKEDADKLIDAAIKEQGK